MNCNEVQQELMLQFGSGELAEEIRLHLGTCPVCRNLAAELEMLEKRLGDDEDFFPGDAEVERLAASVDATIDRIESRRVTSVVPARRLFPTKYLAVAAAIVLILGAYLVGQFSGDRYSSSADLENDGSFSAVWSETDLEAYEPSDPAVEILIGDYAETARLSGADELLSDITEEEYEYMMENFDIGDLL